MARAVFVKKARKDNPDQGIKKGDSYWWWSFRIGSGFRKCYSKTRPRPSQLTQSDFLSNLYSIQERIEDLKVEDFAELDDIESERDDIVGELQNLRDETDEKFNNMPEGLQDGDTGQLLQERVDSLDSYISEVEGVSADTVAEFIEELQSLSCDAS